MNISLLCTRKAYNFVLPLEVSLNYIKKLSCKIFKCELLDIYYRGEKITKVDNNEKTLLKDIISEGETNIKLKIVLNPTLSTSTKNQTSSISNTPLPTSKGNKTSLDLEGITEFFSNSNKKLIQTKNNKLFEALYNQKSRGLFSTIKVFHNKIIEIDNYLYKKKPNNKDDNLINFENNLYEFIDGLKLYFTRLITTLEDNDYSTYSEIVQNLNSFYNELFNLDEIEPKKNSKTTNEVNNTMNINNINNTIASTPINKFPINLKKSDYNLKLNSDRGNYFNKSSQKSSIKKALLLNNKNALKNTFDIKKNLNNSNNNIKTIGKNIDEKNVKKSKFIKLTNDENNNSNNIEINDKKNSVKNKDETHEGKKNTKEIELDLNSSKNITESNLSQKSINNISEITKKSNEDNDEDSNNINNSSKISKESDSEKNKQVVPLNLDLINNITDQENKKLPKKVNQNYNQKKYSPKNDKFNSIIQENENESLTHSSIENYTNKNKNEKKNNYKSKKNSSKNNNKNNINTKNNNVENNKNNINNKNDATNKKISDIYQNLTPLRSNQIRQSVRINSIPKRFNIEGNTIKKFEPRKSVLNPPIYNVYISNENEMAKVLSRKAQMKKRKNKTSNKYDFII